jgi:hypothetical protein
MTTLQEIENLLDIEIGDTRLRDGKKIRHKNKYYYYADQYYIVMMTKGKWGILEDCKTTRRLLRLHCWCFNDRYIRTFGKKGHWHQRFLNYEDSLVCDHINHKTFDNRSDNLRIITQELNMRNCKVKKNNKTGINGIHYDQTAHRWQAYIRHDGKQYKSTFSVNKYGDDEAKQLAIEWRKQQEVEHGYIGD